jgi:ribosomal protein S18 acetylase RimI-like enzyme
MAREVLRMEIRLEQPTPSPAWPAGVAVRTAQPEADAAAVYALLELAFRGSAEEEKPYDEWLPWWVEDAEFDPSAWFLAEEDGALVGVALCWSSGFLKDLAVHPACRRRGIGRALLLHVFGEFRSRGAATVSLKVDAANPTGAVRVYEAAGMRVAERLFV